MAWETDGRPVYKSAETYFWGATTEDSVRGGRVIKVKKTDPDEYPTHVYVDGIERFTDVITDVALAAGTDVDSDVYFVREYGLIVMRVKPDGSSVDVEINESDNPSGGWNKIRFKDDAGNWQSTFTVAAGDYREFRFYPSADYIYVHLVNSTQTDQTDLIARISFYLGI